MDIEKLISTIRTLKEEPTVNVGSGHIAGTAPAVMILQFLRRYI